MRISKTALSSAVNFNRALTTSEEKDFKKTTNEALNALNQNDGIRIFKVFQTSLPTNSGQNLGIGKLNSDSAMDYLEYMSLYTASNAIKVFPMGQFPYMPRFEGYYCPYERYSSVIGIDNINFFKLTQSAYGKLLTQDDLKSCTVSDNTSWVDYENELDYKRGVDIKLLFKAYRNMQTQNTLEARKIRHEFENYKSSLTSDTLDRLAIAPFVKNRDRDLFQDFNQSREKKRRFKCYKKTYKNEIDFYKFGKFLALKNLQEAKQGLNKRGLELYGDCPIGFSDDEVFAFPNAFYPENITPGWGFRAINYDEITKEGTEANRLFREKISWHLENFDGIRFDVGWQYFKPKVFEFENDKKYNYQINVNEGEIVDFIERTAKEIKGSDYDTKKLMYECDAGPEDFTMFNWQNRTPVLKSSIKGRTPVITTVYESTTWGNPRFYSAAGVKDYMIGTNNHDSTPLGALSQDKEDDKGNEVVELENIRKNNVKALHQSLGLSEDWLSVPENFVQAKFAELFQAKNHFVFFNDVMGNKNRLDHEGTSAKDYRLKINDSFEEEYHSALQNNQGFNLAQSLKIAMKAQALDKTNPELYAKICKYSAILRENGPKTRQEADLKFNCTV